MKQFHVWFVDATASIHVVNLICLAIVYEGTVPVKLTANALVADTTGVSSCAVNQLNQISRAHQSGFPSRLETLQLTPIMMQ